MNIKKIFSKKILVTLAIIIVSLVLIYLSFPKIHLYGDENLNISYTTNYSEAGYKAKILFFDITDKVVVEGNVSNNIGEYEISYILDLKIMKIKKTRKVIVSDLEKPIIKLSINEINVCPNSKLEDYIDKIKYEATDEVDGDLTDIVNIYESNGKVVYSVKDKSGNETIEELTVNYIDLEKPTIKLHGYDTIYLKYGTKYSEPGYEVSDNCTKDVKVTVEGSVDNKVGKYTLTYKAKDDSGNIGETKRNVVVYNYNPSSLGTIKNGTIYLTFDDGPSAATTGYILDVLKEENVRATFFVTSNGPDYLIKRMYDEGHTVALHTSTHDYKYIYSSVDNYMKDLNNVSARVKRITGYESKIIRFPGGSSNTISRNYKKGIMTELTGIVTNMGYKYYDWNVDSNDAGGASTSYQVYYNVISNLNKNRANMVLMHDVKVTTKGAIRDIIHYGKANGYEFKQITMDTYMIRHGVNN